MIDEFTRHEYGMSRLIKTLRNLPEFQTEFQDACSLQLYLLENIRGARIHGRDPSQRTELHRILHQLTALSLHTTGKSFNEWCDEEPVQTRPSAGSIPTPLVTRSVSDYLCDIYQNLQWVHQLFSATTKIYQFECEDATQKLQEPTLPISALNTTAPGEMIVAIHHIQHCVKEIIALINTFSSHCEKRPTSDQRYLILKKLNDTLQYMRQDKAISIHIRA